MMEHDQRQASFEGMLEYGKSAIRSLFLVNGGAIVTLFALISSVLEHGSKTAIAAMVPGLWFFVGGLTLAIVPAFMGYLNFSHWYARHPAEGASFYLRSTTWVALVAALLSLTSFLLGVCCVARAIPLL